MIRLRFQLGDEIALVSRLPALLAEPFLKRRQRTGDAAHRFRRAGTAASRSVEIGGDLDLSAHVESLKADIQALRRRLAEVRSAKAASVPVIEPESYIEGMEGSGP